MLRIYFSSLQLAVKKTCTFEKILCLFCADVLFDRSITYNSGGMYDLRSKVDSVILARLRSTRRILLYWDQMGGMYGAG